VTKPNFPSSKTLEILNEIDWDSFDKTHDQDSLGILHWYPATFISNIPSNLIELFSSEGDLVWDPFCGSGCAGVEAIKRNRNFVGNDINYIACKISRAKLTLIARLENVIEANKQIQKNLIEFLFSHSDSNDKEIYQKNSILNGESINELASWYNNYTLKRLLLLHSFVFSLSFSEEINNYFEVIFLTVARISNAQQKTWGHIADNVKPKLIDIQNRGNVDPIKLFLDRSARVIEKAKKIAHSGKLGAFDVFENHTAQISLTKKADIVITSPPYPWMCDYITSQRLSFYWTNNSQEKIDQIKKLEIGARFARKSSARSELYIKNMSTSFFNIKQNMKDKATLCLVYPICEKGSLREKTLSSVEDSLKTLFTFQMSTTRNLEKYKRSSPFSSMNSEKITIWRN